MELNLRDSLGRNRYGKANSYDVGVGMFASAQGSKHCDRLLRSGFEGDSPAQTQSKLKNIYIVKVPSDSDSEVEEIR